jgi:diguanylate cyclase (GGDEF)-like protein
MATAGPARPSLWRPTLFALTWQVCTWLGWALVVLAVLRLGPGGFRDIDAPLVMITVIVLLSELRPIVMTRLVGNPVSISLAFVFATMYLWGLYPALLLQTASVVLAEVLSRKPAWKLLFNVGQYAISLAAAWLVLVAFGVTPSPEAPLTAMSAADLAWIVGSWVVYHLVNLTLVAGLAADEGKSWWDSFSEEFWYYSVSALAVMALSPLVAIVAMAYPYSWTLLPLLLLPLLAVQKTAEISREREHEALHDPLTGLPNRVLLTDRIEQALARGIRLSGQVVVIFLDLDLFKVVNDSLGHAAGDALLVDVSQRLATVVRSGDTLARFGGDEFVIVCDNLNAIETDALADRVTEVLREPFNFEGRMVTVTASIGIALAAPHSVAQTLLRDADAAMYRAKEAGRDRVMLFDEDMHRSAAARLDDEIGLRRALDEGELRVHYQPIMDIPTDTVVGLEALVRWQTPDRGLVDPGQFLPVAEETGLILPLGFWVLDHALAQMQDWRKQIPEAEDLWISVNLSARQMLAPGVVNRVAQSLAASGLPPAAAHLEITESTVMDDLQSTADIMLGLRALGVSLDVDDFGTGYSSLAYLKQLPVTALKIDRSFIDGVADDDQSDRPIVEAIVKMAQTLGLTVIAEGVESSAQLVALRKLGVRMAQGFLWSEPLPEEEVRHWIGAPADRKTG